MNRLKAVRKNLKNSNQGKANRHPRESGDPFSPYEQEFEKEIRKEKLEKRVAAMIN